MTIATTANKAIGLGNGVNTNWPFLFIIPLASQLYVYYTDTLGNITAIPAGQYSVAGLNNPDGGSVTYPLSGAPIATGTTLTVYRLVPYQQLADVTNQGAFYPEIYEAALDYLTMEVQQLQEITGRSLTLPLTTVGVSTTLPTPIAGLAIGWNVTATALSNIALTGSIPVPVPINYGGTGQATAALGFAALAATSIALQGVLAPAQITANQNDYNPSGLPAACTLRISSNASRNITGIAGGAEGRVLVLVNVGATNPIVLKNNDAGSAAANRLALNGDVTLASGQAVTLQYDNSSLVWRQFGLSPDGEYRSTQVFTGSGTWNKPAGLKRIKVTIVGGGGGSGGAAQGVGTGAGGGAGGGFSIKWIESASLGATETITVGAGGTGGAAGANNGTAGGTTSFGAHCSATGGAAGAGATASNVLAGSTPGVGSGGNVNGNGTGSGQASVAGASGFGGLGGSSILGGGGHPPGGNANGNPGNIYGGGASGACSNNSSTAAGAAGAAGICIVEEFY